MRPMLLVWKPPLGEPLVSSCQCQLWDLSDMRTRPVSATLRL